MTPRQGFSQIRIDLDPDGRPIDWRIFANSERGEEVARAFVRGIFEIPGPRSCLKATLMCGFCRDLLPAALVRLCFRVFRLKGV